jgi:hypothetical protein
LGIGLDFKGSSKLDKYSTCWRAKKLLTRQDQSVIFGVKVDLNQSYFVDASSDLKVIVLKDSEIE